jgi:hypothetical protein
VIAALIAGLVAGYGIAMPVGAVATYLVALTARSSLKVGVFAALGVASADSLYALFGTLPLLQEGERVKHPEIRIEQSRQNRQRLLAG